MPGSYYYIYSVTLHGKASGWSFSRTGKLALADYPITTVATTNGINAADILLVSGSPAANPQRGAIKYATNSSLVSGMANLDLAFVTYDQTKRTLKIRPDGRLTYAYPSYWTSTSGLTANLHTINGGSIELTFSQDFLNIKGSINITSTLRGTYRATLSGTFLGQSAFLPRG